MFEIADKKDIGIYLANLVLEKYESQTAFCKEWIAKENLDSSDEILIQNKKDRFSKIKNGTRGIQIDDLPIFCDLLNITCEELLSAGRTIAANESRLTNYSVASSKDQNVWDNYLNNESKLILNADEYGMTVLDYAVKFKNIDLIEYLIKNDFIWFDNQDKGLNVLSFGAGTKFECKFIGQREEDLKSELANFCYDEKKIRNKLIELAIEKGDLNILKQMHAREIPDYYFNPFRYYYVHNKNYDIVKNFYNKNIIESISKSSNRVAEYFTDSFKIEYQVVSEGEKIKRTSEYTYLFISKLLESLVRNHHPYTKQALISALNYNKDTYFKLNQQLKSNVELNFESYKSLGKGKFNDEYLQTQLSSIKEEAFNDINIDKQTNILRLRTYGRGKDYDALIRNLIHISVQSKDRELQYFIDEVNNYYQKIMDIRNNLM